ncbi:MAG: ATPase [Geminicoccaceae bacterium]|nr:ATPase [Geminicoccaceae bacterium]
MRRTILALATIAAFAVAAPPARAQHAVGEGADAHAVDAEGPLRGPVGIEAIEDDVAAHVEAGEHGGGMPQLNAATFPSQILWLILSFVLLYWLMKNRGLPRVARILETRQARIDGSLERATKLRGDAEAAYARHEKLVAEARARAAGDVQAMRERTGADLAKRQHDLDAKLNARIEEAEARVAASRAEAMQGVDAVAAEVASAMLERLVGASPPESDVKAAVERAKGEAA